MPDLVRSFRALEPGVQFVLRQATADVPPNYPASHGCLRAPIPDAVFIYNNISIGEPIYVYS